MRVRNFLLHMVNKKFLVFLFFLVLSGAFWLMMTLNETYDNEYSVPMRLVNIPKNVIITDELPDTVLVTIRDKGFNLLNYEIGHKLIPLEIDFADYANKGTGHGVVSPVDVQRLLAKQLYGSSKVTEVSTVPIDFFFNYGTAKRVPVRIYGKIVPEQNYYLSNTRFQPDSVTVYGNNETLKGIKYAYTEYVRVVNLDDTLTQVVSLRKMRGIKCVPAVIRMTLYPDFLMEESVEVPIEAVNMPDGKILRMFPSKVKVSFVIGASMFKMIKPEQFSVVADYSRLEKGPADKCDIYLRTYPHGISNVKLDLTSVDYLIEQQ